MTVVSKTTEIEPLEEWPLKVGHTEATGVKLTLPRLAACRLSLEFCMCD
jgi:hypothetical protein